jgi:hypothetical protein
VTICGSFVTIGKCPRWVDKVLPLDLSDKDIDALSEDGLRKVLNTDENWTEHCKRDLAPTIDKHWNQEVSKQ